MSGLTCLTLVVEQSCFKVKLLWLNLDESGTLTDDGAIAELDIYDAMIMIMDGIFIV